MIGAITFTLLILGFLTMIPAVFLTLQIGAALLPIRRSASVASASCPRFAILMPAHNEEAIIARVIASITSQLPPTGQLLVIADNCSDDTARVASEAGAAVVIRQDMSQVGKGYALAFGARSLQSNPPQIVVIIDADCEVMPGALEILVQHCITTGHPVQAHYAMQAPEAPSPADKMSRLAWTVKTFVRPLGSLHLGWPCQLMGSGMALPFDIVRQFDLATGHLAEDQKLGAELALADKSPLFCPNARILSRLPKGETGKREQRTRWEHGHLAIIGEFFLPLVGHALSKRSLQRLAFALDLCVPPLALFAMVLILTFGASLIWFVLTDITSPLLVSAGALALFTSAIAGAWWRFGKEIISLHELAAGPAYCLRRIPSYIRFLVNRQVAWVRTER
ncbi:MAG TPA: glycosyltransferase family 2 protein [Beijerinckiaceae bacterium]|jgi:glycosyltransferase involved in cell wall biosynthesis|nr:glycosyltransferase family 2 protein [Beijerinckiaceae bacterium]